MIFKKGKAVDAEQVGAELGVDPEVLVAFKQPEHLVGYGSYPRLQRGAARGSVTSDGSGRPTVARRWLL